MTPMHPHPPRPGCNVMVVLRPVRRPPARPHGWGNRRQRPPGPSPCVHSIPCAAGGESSLCKDSVLLLSNPFAPPPHDSALSVAVWPIQQGEEGSFRCASGQAAPLRLPVRSAPGPPYRYPWPVNDGCSNITACSDDMSTRTRAPRPHLPPERNQRAGRVALHTTPPIYTTLLSTAHFQVYLPFPPPSSAQTID